MKTVQNATAIRSAEVEELLGDPPGWITKWGIIMIAMIVSGMLLITFIMKYPDTIAARAVLLSKNPPIHIAGKMAGKVQSLLVTNGAQVTEGQYLAIMENSGDYKDILSLKKLLSAVVTRDQQEQIIGRLSKTNLNAGALQEDYLNLRRKGMDIENFKRLQVSAHNTRSIRRQIAENTEYLLEIKDQNAILKTDLEIRKKQLGRDSLLYHKKVISENQMEESQSAYLQRKFQFLNSLSSANQIKTKIGLLVQELLTEEKKYEEEKYTLYNNFDQARGGLLAAINLWEQTYVLASPIDGVVSFDRVWSSNQFISVGENLFSIVPAEQQNIIGRIELPIAGSGKVKTGQRVVLKLDNFPYTEYGSIAGVITSMSLVPNKNSQGPYYSLEAKFPDELISSFGQKLLFSQEMQGNAEIVTADRRLISRLLGPALAVWDESF